MAQPRLLSSLLLLEAGKECERLSLSLEVVIFHLRAIEWAIIIQIEIRLASLAVRAYIPVSRLSLNLQSLLLLLLVCVQFSLCQLFGKYKYKQYWHPSLCNPSQNTSKIMFLAAIALEDSTCCSKTLLVFKHNQKAGGGSIKSVWHKMKNYRFLANFVKVSKFYQKYLQKLNHIGEEKLLISEHTSHEEIYCKEIGVCINGLNCKYSLEDLVGRYDTAVFIEELYMVDPVIQQHVFVISSIRKPCDHYL